MSASIEDYRALFREFDAEALMKKLRENDSSGIEQVDVFLELSEGLKSAKKDRQDDIFTTKDAFRFATRKEAMQSRLKRMVNENPKVIVDAAAGIGLAAMEFSRIADNVLCFEIDPLKCLLLEKNMALYGIKNYSVYNLDSTSSEAKEIIGDAEIIFVDPERTSGSELRKIEENKPALEYFIKTFKNKMIVYEISPRIDVLDIAYNCEIELYSEKRRHARTTLYFAGEDERLMRAVSDSGEEIEGAYSEYDYSAEVELLDLITEGAEIADIDETIEKAGLLNEISDFKSIAKCGNAIIGTGGNDKTPFCIIRKVTARAEKISELKDAADSIGDFSRVVLRYSVSQDDYWKQANSVRKSGSGTRNVYVYKIAGKFISAIDS